LTIFDRGFAFWQMTSLPLQVCDAKARRRKIARGWGKLLSSRLTTAQTWQARGAPLRDVGEHARPGQRSALGPPEATLCRPGRSASLELPAATRAALCEAQALAGPWYARAVATMFCPDCGADLDPVRPGEPCPTCGGKRRSARVGIQGLTARATAHIAVLVRGALVELAALPEDQAREVVARFVATAPAGSAGQSGTFGAEAAALAPGPATRRALLNPTARAVLLAIAVKVVANSAASLLKVGAEEWWRRFGPPPPPAG